MGTDVYCCFCGNACNSGYVSDDIANIENKDELDKITKWLDNVTILLINGKVVHNCHDAGWGPNFDCGDSSYMGFIWYDMNYFGYHIENKGLLTHTDCWNYVCKKYNKNININDIPITINPLKKMNSYTDLRLDYGKIEKYHDQSIDFKTMYNDKNLYMCFSPLINKKNATRINKIISQLKIKKPVRISPSVSATFYKEGDVKIGNTNNFWIIKKGKWLLIKENIIQYTFKFVEHKKFINKNKQKINKVNKIPQIGMSNKIPLFVKDHTNNKIDFIGTEKTITALKKLLDSFSN
jgi:hypothetical protein